MMIARGDTVMVLDVGKVDFIDIGTPETLAAADDFIASRKALFQAGFRQLACCSLHSGKAKLPITGRRSRPRVAPSRNR